MSFSLIFAGTVTGGTFKPDNADLYQRWHEKNEGKRIQVGLRRETPLRSVPANNYLWHCYGIIAVDTGNAPNTVHQGLKREAVRLGVLPPQYVHLGDRVIETEPTTVVPSDVFSRYVEWMRAYSASELGIPIPAPNEIE